MNFLVNKEQTGLKLVHFLSQNLDSSYSIRGIKKAIEDKLCLVNGKVERFASYKVSAGDKVIFHVQEIQKIKKLGFDKKRILFEDQFLLVYDKPAKIISDRKEFNNFFLVNRLDRDTTGVIILAKSAEVKKKMISLYQNEKVKKEYVAIVDGVPKEKSGYITSSIGKKLDRSGKEIHAILKKGKPAKTFWKCKKKGKDAALISLILITGRTHQLRLHMKSLGHPILGDFDYSRDFECKYYTNRILLHSLKVTFPHPETGESIIIKAPVPSDFINAKEAIIK